LTHQNTVTNQRSKQKIANRHTILCDERIIQCTQSDEPIPATIQFEHNGSSPESDGHIGGPQVGDIISLSNYINVPESTNRRHRPGGGNQGFSLVIPGIPPKMEEVPIPRMVNCQQQTQDPVLVFVSTRDKVCKSWRVARAMLNKGRESLWGTKSRERGHQQNHER